jgi:hypothetical protein
MQIFRAAQVVGVLENPTKHSRITHTRTQAYSCTYTHTHFYTIIFLRSVSQRHVGVYLVLQYLIHRACEKWTGQFGVPALIQSAKDRSGTCVIDQDGT